MFLPYSLAIVSGYEAAIQTVSSGALDKAADAGQHIMDHLSLWQLHAANAVLYLCATPIQFLPSVRKRSLPLHRASGYLFLSTGTVLAFSGLIMAPLSEFPGFVPPSVALAVIWVLFGGVAMWKIKKKRVQEHREWMVRVAAAGYSVILTRPLVIAVHLVSGLSHRAAGQSATWLSLLIMVAGTEMYIQSRHRLDSNV
ncbi:hypothetical protein KFL_007520020 [Klebsormidium nitens]|uniref:DUF2306 domain-containing protein n=1 Tax=Klebsormidium nitens TaxID=105231 RepID=A0A1Y1IPV8_KLENI|nr:hypothetical protein KFL_007520020 [Klebsormidium nitens]|eukprot:GAQ91251.1 hypothetical protein KFL_007520020 [Klebsormidium nitens]